MELRAISPVHNIFLISYSMWRFHLQVYKVRQNALWQDKLWFLKHFRIDDVSILNDQYLQFRVENTGKVEWELPKIFITHCDVDVQYFPFDVQVCSVELTSWAYSINELIIAPLYEDVKTEDMK